LAVHGSAQRWSAHWPARDERSSRPRRRGSATPVPHTATTTCRVMGRVEHRWRRRRRRRAPHIIVAVRRERWRRKLRAAASGIHIHRRRRATVSVRSIAIAPLAAAHKSLLIEMGAAGIHDSRAPVRVYRSDSAAGVQPPAHIIIGVRRWNVTPLTVAGVGPVAPPLHARGLPVARRWAHGQLLL
jgi:hypothetical protein